MYCSISISQQLKKIFKNLNINQKRTVTMNTKLRDITDGNVYKKFPKYQKTSSAKIFIFTLNTDGISLCEKSNLGNRPIYLAVNEIPINQRFCLENIIVAGFVKQLYLFQFIYFFFNAFLGLSVRMMKPNFDILLNPILKELKDLEY